MGRKLVLLLVAAALVAGTADARPRVDRVPASSRISGVPALQDQVLSAINDLRRSKGLAELTLNPALSLAAVGHSQSMALHGYFTHEGWNGSSFWTRIKVKYRPQLGNKWGVGENMVWASPELSADQRDPVRACGRAHSSPPSPTPRGCGREGRAPLRRSA